MARISKLKEVLHNKFLEGVRSCHSYPLISKEVYISLFNVIKEQQEYEDICHKSFSTILENDYVSCFSNRLTEPLVDLMEELTRDTDKWLTYFIWECAMGKESRTVKIDGKKFKLGSITDVWELVTR